jgi:hypothetical protein
MTRSSGTHRIAFNEAAPDAWSARRQRLLQSKIEDLRLKIEGTYLEPIIGRLYAELEGAGIDLKPRVYLAEEWACPDGVPVIGIPFYLADPALTRIEDEMMDGVEAQSEHEILSYLRHEAGHAFDYAYKLHETDRWRALFGDMSLPYRDEYAPLPFSRNFVVHIPAWYAQKHPDEDFAETFAVWLDPHSNWRERYRAWGCYDKLLYVDAVVKEVGRTPPVVSGADFDFASEQLAYSIADHYARSQPELTEVGDAFDAELRQIFRSGPATADDATSIDAHLFVLQHRRTLVRRLSHWTGLYDVRVKSLIHSLVDRIGTLGLRLDPQEGSHALIDLTAFAATLCMNRLYKGDFVVK